MHRRRLQEAQVARGAPGGDAARRVDVRRELVDQPDVNVQREPGLGQRLPHPSSSSIEIRVAMRVAAHQGPDHPGVPATRSISATRLVDAAVREQHDGARVGPGRRRSTR